jgi:flagellar protein FlaG
MSEISPTNLPLPAQPANAGTTSGATSIPTTQTRGFPTSTDSPPPQSELVNSDATSPKNLQDTTNAVDTIKELVQHLDRDLAFHIDDVSGKTVITVLNKSTQEVIRQIPNEEVLSMAQRLKEGGGLIGDLIG